MEKLLTILGNPSSTPLDQHLNKMESWDKLLQTLYGRMKTVMLIARIDLDQRAKFWLEAVATATKWSKILVGEDNNNPLNFTIFP
jgi:hypothetical protein